MEYTSVDRPHLFVLKSIIWLWA